MKYFTKFLSLFFAAAMLLTMAACGSKNTDTDTDTKTGSEKKQLVVATSPDSHPSSPWTAATSWASSPS